MTLAEKQQELLPIGTRVTHFDGGPNTHGTGTIVAYNGVGPSSYLQSNFKDAVEMAAEAGLLGGLINSFYDKNRCPYVVRWDIPSDPEKRREYPRGYKDVYEHSSVKPSKAESNIFPDNGNVAIMERHWIEQYGIWAGWQTSNEASYEASKDNANYEFCIRPRPTKLLPKYSPQDESFISLSEGGFHPPTGIFVEFSLKNDPNKFIRGLTAQLGDMGPWRRSETVFTCVELEQRRVYFMNEVDKWRHLADKADYTPAMRTYLLGALPTVIPW